MRFLPTALLSTIFCGVSTSGASNTPVPETAVFGSICQPNRPRRRDNALSSEISCELLRTEANLLYAIDAHRQLPGYFAFTRWWTAFLGQLRDLYAWLLTANAIRLFPTRLVGHLRCRCWIPNRNVCRSFFGYDKRSL